MIGAAESEPIVTLRKGGADYGGACPSRGGPLETVTSLAGQSRDDNRATAVRSSTAVNLLADGNMIARRVLRDRGTPRNTLGTYEYNPVDRVRGGWRSEAKRDEESGEEMRGPANGTRAVSMPHVPHPDQIRRAARENTRRGL